MDGARDVHSAGRNGRVTQNLIRDRAVILLTRLGVERAVERVVGGRGDTHVSDGKATKERVGRVDGLPERDSNTEDLAVLGAALLHTSVRVGALWVGLVAGRVIAPHLHSNTVLVDVAPGWEAAHVSNTADVEVVGVVARVLSVVITTIAQRGEVIVPGDAGKVTVGVLTLVV